MAKRSSRRQLSFSGGDDDLCKLCQCHNSHLSSPASWRNEQARSHVLSLQVPPDSLVCRPCRHDVTRVLANPCYVPRWRKGKTSAKNSTCCILGCSSVTLSAVGSTSEVHHAFESMGLKCSSEVIPTPTPLCKYHYHLTYNALQPRECATCGTRLRGNNHRPCPKPDVIQEHLRERTGFEGEIHSQDRVCITCYKSHLVVLKADPQRISRDNDLKQLVSTYIKQMPAIQRGATSSDVIKAAMARTVVHVGNILLQNQAILLPTIHSVFTSYITDLLKGTDIGIEDIGHISSRWVLSDLTTSLQHHITYSCKIRKYGTLVYRLGADLTPSLSEALWRLRSTETSTNEPKAPDGPATCSRDLDHINKLVHKQIANFLAQDAHSPFEHDEVNFDDLITQIDPELWNIVCTLTKSKSENRGTSKVTDPLSPAYHVKRIRRLFLICTILFCTDDRCSMPLHTLLTDTVESQGGSALLVQILNRLGVCASSDTLSRFIQYQVSKDKPDVKYLKPDTFTLISADNIDFMHSFARVYCGHQTSSWHGTTVQAAQPLPSLSLPEMDPSSVSLLPAPMDPSQIGPPATSPTMDPSYVGLKPAPMNPSQRGPPATCPTMDPSYVGLKPAPMNPSQRGPPATCPNMDPSSVGLKPTPMNPSQRGPPATCPNMDPSSVGLKPTPMNPSQRGPPATCPNMDPSSVGLKPTPMNPSQIGPPATSPTMDPSYVGLKPAPMNPSQIGPPATSPTMDPSYVGLKPAPMNPSQIGPPATSPTMDPSYVGLKPAPMNPSQIGPPATSPTMDPSYVGLKPAPMNPSPRGPPATCPTMDPSSVGLKPTPMNPSQRGPPATCPNMDPSSVGLKPTPMNPSQIGPPATSPTMDPSYVGLKPAPMNPSQRGPPATCPTMDPSYVGLKPAPMNPSQRGPPATCPNMDPSYVGLKPAPMNPSQIGPPATSPTMDPSYVGLKPAPMNPSQRGPTATCPTMDPSYVGLKPAPMNPSQRGPTATCPTMDPSYGLKPAPMNPSQRGPTITCPTMDPSYVGLKPAPMDPSQIGPPATYSHTMSVLSRKRTERSSPIHSPMKLTRSPLAKVQRRLRTGTERQKQQAKSQAPELAHGHSSHHSSLSLSDFLMSERETDALVDLQKDLDSYILHRVAISTSTSQKPFLNIQDFFSCIRVTHTEKSQIVYLEVMDSIADRKDTVMQLLHDLHQRFIADKDMQWLVLEGDAKLYEIMKSLQFEYGDELSWVIPYPGDWHMLMNYQSALMKAYYDAGLKALARAAGYPLAAIQNSSQFKRSHNFILEVWEAIYRVMLERYIESKGKETTTKPSLLEDIASHLQSLSATDLSHTLNTALPTFCTQTRNHFNNFKSFIQVLARTDDTWRFWVQFVFQDAMAYIGLFLAIRSGDWQLRMASMKSMAALFTAFDHPTYQKLISQHLADILTMPTPIVTMFQQGAFVVSILGRPWHSVAIDESHEMLINKDCKSSVVRPLPDYINRIAHYMPYRSKSVKNFQLQLFPTKKDQYTIIKSPLSSNPSDIKCNHNIQAQIQVIETNKLLILTDTNRGLINPFTKKEATAGQHHDLLNFRSVGQQEFLLRISSVILKQPSVHAPNRRRRLQTFSERKVNKSRITQLEKDKKLIMSAMKKKIQFSRKIGRAIETPGEQLIELPLAISDNAGNLLKGQKSYTSKCLESRYKSANPQVFLTNLPWTPHCTLLEGMFLINTNSLGSHKTLGDYAKFIMTRFLLMQFK